MKLKFKYIGSIAATVITFVISGCEKNFLDINTDPKNPVDLPLTQILPAAETGLAFNLSMNIGGFNSAASTFVHQIFNNRVNEYIIDGTPSQMHGAAQVPHMAFIQVRYKILKELLKREKQ